MPLLRVGSRNVTKVKFRLKNFRGKRKNLTLVQFFRAEILSVINIKLNG